MEPEVSGVLSLDEIQSNGSAERGAWGKSFAFVQEIQSNGTLIVVPYIFPTSNELKQIISTSGTIIATVFELGETLRLGEIGHLRGRVLFGYPEAPFISQIYEISKNRSMEITEVPEDPYYAVLLNTTEFNITGEELRQGTVDITFVLTDEAQEIEKITVLLKSPSGTISLDKMRVVDFASETYDPHILYKPDPLKYISTYRIPIHCISKKENEFLIEVEYHNPRIIPRKEIYRMPIKVNIDDKKPYINTAEYYKLYLVNVTKNPGFILDTSDKLKPIYLKPDDINVATHLPTKNMGFESLYDTITRIFLTPNDINVAVQCISKNIYFRSIYDNLYTGQIGG